MSICLADTLRLEVSFRHGANMSFPEVGGTLGSF